MVNLSSICCFLGAEVAVGLTEVRGLVPARLPYGGLGRRRRAWAKVEGARDAVSADVRPAIAPPCPWTSVFYSSFQCLRAIGALFDLEMTAAGSDDDGWCLTPVDSGAFGEPKVLTFLFFSLFMRAFVQVWWDSCPLYPTVLYLYVYAFLN